MAAYDIEIILSRQWSDCLSIPVFIVDPTGNLLFYNEPAEGILGKRYEETGVMPVAVWSTIFKQFDDEGNPIAPEDLPLMITLTQRIPAHKSFWIENLQGEKHKIFVTSFPVIGRGNRFSGAIAIFWKQ